MNQPPQLAPANPSRTHRAASWAFGSLLCLLAIARSSVGLGFALPLCAWKRITGFPCPLCGSTRCLEACSHLHFVDALRWNPLTFLLCLAIVLWFALSLPGRSFPRQWREILERPTAVSALRVFVAGAVLLNWLYLGLTRAAL